MKKYLFGILALVLAVGFSSFTKFTKVRTADTRVFFFDGTGNFQSQSDMQDKSKWLYEGTVDEVDLCDGASQAKGCKIVIDQAQLSSTPTANATLSSVSTGFSITANQTSSPWYRVQSVVKSSYAASISNQIP